MRRSWTRLLAALLVVGGVGLAGLAALVDWLGIGGSPGLGAEQVLGILVGWTSAVLGIAVLAVAGRRGFGARAGMALVTLGLWLAGILVFGRAWLAHEAELAQERQGAGDAFLEDALISIGYLDWSTHAADPAESGVTAWDRGRAWPGYTLICSRQRPEVYLFDLAGRIVHMWSLPDAVRDGEVGTLEGARLLGNGDLLVVSKFHELARLDWSSQLRWRVPLEAHHDVTVTPDGELYTWVREIQPFWGLPVRFPFLARLSPDGQVVERWSTREELDTLHAEFDDRHFLDERLFELHRDRLVAWLQDRLPADRVYDFFHPNTVQWIGPNANQDHPAFREGNLIVCLRNIDQIATLDPESFEILWTWGEHDLQWPHHPTLLPNGNVLVFDNGIRRRHTRILELDPIAGEIVWEYPQDPDDGEHRFFSAYKGSAQRLPNGNTLIGDGENGRVVEVSPAGEIVWEFFYPEVNEQGQRAAIYRALRYPAPLVEGLIERHGARLEAAPDW